MKAVTYTVHPEKREDLFARLRVELEREPDVRFAYLYGSLLESDRIHDVDVGIFLEDAAVTQKAGVTDTLSAKLTATFGLPVDVRVINDAPLSFLYHVLRGHLLLCRDEAFLTDMMEDVARRYLDLAPLLRISTKDAFAA
ncbi:MAG: nucleotidyltransferase domain-containing protein [Nitrospira sp.]|nr:nucleotidyltransferase domain-containing protein [Nitrospira sp.]